MSKKSSIPPEKVKILVDAYQEMIEVYGVPAKFGKQAILKILILPVLSGYPTDDLQGYMHEYSFFLILYEFLDKLLEFDEKLG